MCVREHRPAGAIDQQKRRDVESILSWCIILPLVSEVAQQAATIYRNLKARNQLIEIRDILIAATALTYDLPLMTLNRERQLAAFKTYDAFPALLETHSDPFFYAPVEFLGVQPARQLWRDTARKITAISTHKQSAFAEEVVGTELSNVLEHGKSIPIALADAQRLLERRAHR